LVAAQRIKKFYFRGVRAEAVLKSKTKNESQTTKLLQEVSADEKGTHNPSLVQAAIYYTTTGQIRGIVEVLELIESRSPFVTCIIVLPFC